MSLIIPEGEVGPVAPPDIITTDLDAYIKGIIKSREKDWDIMGARRIAHLWSGEVGLKRKPSNKLDRAMMRMRSNSRDVYKSDDGDESPSAGHRGAFGKVTAKTGQVIKGGLGLVSRRNTQDETSESDTGGGGGGGGGPGAGSLRHSLMRRKQSSLIPTVLEPDVEEAVDQLDPGNGLNSLHASPARSRLHVATSYGTTSTKRSMASGMSAAGSQRLSIATGFGADDSNRSHRTTSFIDHRRETGHAGPGNLGQAGSSMRTLSTQAQANRALPMLRTTSDGADVILDRGGNEWTVINPQGAFKGQKPLNEEIQALKRR